MKKLLLLTLLLLLPYSALFSARNFYLNLGLKLGVGMLSYWGEKKHKTDSLFASGFFLYMPLGFPQFFEVEPAIAYLGGEVDVAHEVTSIGQKKYRDNLSHLLLPLVFKYYPISGLNFQLGAFFSYLFFKKRLFAALSIRDGKESLNSFDTGTILGLGLKLFGLELEMRYFLGIIPVHITIDNEKFKKSFFLLGLGYSFPLI